MAPQFILPYLVFMLESGGKKTMKYVLPPSLKKHSRTQLLVKKSAMF